MTTREFFEKYAPNLMRDSYSFKTELLTCADRGFQAGGPQGLVDALRRRGFEEIARKVKDSYNRVQAASRRADRQDSPRPRLPSEEDLVTNDTSPEALARYRADYPKTCAICSGPLEGPPADDAEFIEQIKEHDGTFLGDSLATAVLICDPCYQKGKP